MARVFVSHAGEDSGLAGEVHGWLVADGHDVFLDRDLGDGIAVGEDWQQRLHERLRWADAVVCLVTSAYVSSAWCTAEVVLAQSRGSRVLPLLAEPGVVHPLLRSVQHVSVMLILVLMRLGPGLPKPYAGSMPPAVRGGRTIDPRSLGCNRSTSTSVGCSSAAPPR